MPMNPHKDETQTAFMARCVTEMIGTGDSKRPQEQAVAICMDIWRRRDEKKQADGPDPGESHSDFMQRCMEETGDREECQMQWDDAHKSANGAAIVYKTHVSEGTGFDFILSDATEDRFGDVIEPDGWRLTNFVRNPIALFNHNKDFPIGKWSNLRVENGALRGRLELANAGTSARIDEIRSLVDQGILRANSVGFQQLKHEPIKGKSGIRFLQQELLECSLVSVPANPNALQVAKSLNISDETRSLVFSASTPLSANTTVKSLTASTPKIIPSRKTSKMATISERIENAQRDLNAKRDRLAELNAVDTPDLDAIEELNSQIELVERELAARKASEAKIGITAGAPASSGGVSAPAVARRPFGVQQREVRGLDLIVRSLVVRGISHFGGKSIDHVLDERYPGHEATAVITKADQTIGTTTVAGWALEIVHTAYADFLQALSGFSIYPALRDRGIGLSFDGVGTVQIPSRTAGGAGGGFVAEGSPIRVGRITTATTPMTPRKMGVIVPFSRELAKRSTPTIESLVRQAILEDTAAILDPILLDATASDTARPAGLLNGVAAAAVGFGGGDFTAVVEDFKALLGPFYTANAADNITVVMNPAHHQMAFCPSQIQRELRSAPKSFLALRVHMRRRDP